MPNDILTNQDLDENAPPVYPQRREGLIKMMENARSEYKADPYDFETSEIERLTGENARLQGRLEAIRAEWVAVHTLCPVPVFVRDWFAGLSRLIE